MTRAKAARAAITYTTAGLLTTVVAFLASSEAAMMTGSAYVVDGGATA